MDRGEGVRNYSGRNGDLVGGLDALPRIRRWWLLFSISPVMTMLEFQFLL